MNALLFVALGILLVGLVLSALRLFRSAKLKGKEGATAATTVGALGGLMVGVAVSLLVSRPVPAPIGHLGQWTGPDGSIQPFDTSINLGTAKMIFDSPEGGTDEVLVRRIQPVTSSKDQKSAELLIDRMDLVAAPGQRAIIGGAPDHLSGDLVPARVRIRDSVIDARIKLGPNVIVEYTDDDDGGKLQRLHMLQELQKQQDEQEQQEVWELRGLNQKPPK
jgi:hypothetical protein